MTYYDAETHEELTDSDMESRYDDYLDSEGEVQVGGLTFYPSRIIKELDPIAYRCGMSDWESFALEEGDILEELPEDEDEDEE